MFNFEADLFAGRGLEKAVSQMWGYVLVECCQQGPDIFFLSIGTFIFSKPTKKVPRAPRVSGMWRAMCIGGAHRRAQLRREYYVMHMPVLTPPMPEPPSSLYSSILASSHLQTQ